MIVDARQLDSGAVVRTQVCVIGSGAAGTTVAAELARWGVDLVVLEAGGWRAERQAQDTYRGFMTAGSHHDPLELVRQKRIGGTTWMWGGRCVPLDDVDFEGRPSAGTTGWPINREELVPYYRRAHDYCELGKFEYHVDEAVPDAPPFLTDGRPSLVTDDRIWRWSPPVKFSRVLGRLVRSRPKVTLSHHATVVGMERDPLGGRITRVRALTGGGRDITVEAETFVLAAGCLETARLLLASNAQSPRGVGNEHDLVGRYYMTHPFAELGTVYFQDPKRAAYQFQRTRDGVYCRRMLTVSEDTQRQRGLLNMAAALWYPDPRDPAHGDALLSSYALVRAAMARSRLDWKSAGVHRRYEETGHLGRHLANVVGDLAGVARFGTTWVRRRWLARRALPSFMVGKATSGLRFRVDIEQSPEAENRVTLDTRRDALGMPRLVVSHRVSRSDRESVLASLTVIGGEFSRLGAGTVELPSERMVLEELPLGDGTHQMGLTRMADSPRSGVVDRRCRVHGAPNLYVASSSVFPTGGFAGPTLTVVALAIRIANDVRQDVSR